MAAAREIIASVDCLVSQGQDFKEVALSVTVEPRGVNSHLIRTNTG